MALKKQIVVSGIAEISIDGLLTSEQYEKDLGECYIKVETVNGSKKTVLANVTMTNKEGIVRNYSCAFEPNMNGGNFIAQAYFYLKTLPEFANAIDC
jgi:hypothetical protein